MRILILCNYGLGLYKFRKELLEKLIIDNEVFVSLPNSQFTEKFKEIGCIFIDTEYNRRGKNPFADFKLIIKYIQMIKDVKPDIVLTYTVKPNIYGGIACQVCKTPYIENITGMSQGVESGGLLGKLMIILYRVGLRKANKIFFQNEDNKKFMLDKKIVKGNYEVIPGSGVNVDEYKLLDFPNENTIEFAYIGRMIKEKGIDNYLDAARALKEKYSNLVFHICGNYDDEKYKNIIDEYQNRNIVQYHGEIEDTISIYQRVQCVIHPTYYAEGMSNVLLEASASGRALITTNRPGCKEIIDDGKNGFVVNQNDSNDLISKIEKFINLSNEERKQMGLYGRDKIVNNFNRDIVVNKYLDEIERIKNDRTN